MYTLPMQLLCMLVYNDSYVPVYIYVELKVPLVFTMYTYMCISVYSNTFGGTTFHSFSRNCNSFPMNYGLVNRQYKSTSMLPGTIYHE